MRYDVVIIGGGAAGLMCAIEAGKRGRKVAVLEHNSEVGRKILISGGGRCNFTNSYCGPENFLSANPHFAKSALARYRPADFVALVEKHRIPYHEKKLGQLFCDRSARDIIGLLLAECATAGVNVVTGCEVNQVRRTTEFFLATSRGEFRASALVIASGGLSIPKMGASSFGYRLAAQFGLRLEPARPALVPLTVAKAGNRWADMAGVSTEVVASFGKHSFRENMLFTHRGLSGPAILQLSSYWDSTSPIHIDLLPGIDLLKELRERKQDGERAETKTILAAHLPQRLADRWFQHGAPIHAAGSGFVSRPVHGVSDQELARLAAGVHDWALMPAGTEGFAKAEVTAGGVDTNELSSRTFEAKKVRGLFFIGEVVDVTGWLGGFNFQWAWASGYACGQEL